METQKRTSKNLEVRLCLFAARGALYLSIFFPFITFMPLAGLLRR